MIPVAGSDKRRVAGVMSGTSLDGIDVALVTLSGSGRSLVVEDIEHRGQPWPDAVTRALLRVSDPETSSVIDISQLNVRLAHLYAGAVRGTLEASSNATPCSLVGVHGQTIYHVPMPTDFCGVPTRSTLQIGDPSTMANLLGLPVVGDFRMADMALGGQGAPLVPYFDLAVLSDDAEDRLALNLGGIANFTFLPAGGERKRIVAMDTGPANMISDDLSRRMLQRPFDAGGRAAARGVANSRVVEELLSDPYFELAPPKSTGREYFGSRFTDRMLELLAAAGGVSAEDALATSVELTARSVFDACERFVRHGERRVTRVIASGGGTRNETLMNRLSELFKPAVVESIEHHGVPSQAKEAVCFAVLAHEFMNGEPANVPEITGASGRAMLGKLSLPPPSV